MEKKFKLLMIPLPTEISYEQPTTGKRQDGLKKQPSIPVASLTRAEAEEYAKWLQSTFMEHWSEQVGEPLELPTLSN